MKDRDKFLLALLAFWLWSQRKRDGALPVSSPSEVDADTGPEGRVDNVTVLRADKVDWLWPVPTIAAMDHSGGFDTWPAVVSDGFGSPRQGHTHHGVDIMFKRDGHEPDEPDGGTKGFFAPPGTPILAARGGKVWSVQNTSKGWQIVLDHGKPWATMYLHLASVAPGLRKGVVISQGDAIGTMGISPVDAGHVRHLHFEVWHNGGPSAAIDPQTLDMRMWGRKTWNVNANQQSNAS